MDRLIAGDFIKELDNCFTTNDLEGAYGCVCRWEKLALEEQDENLLLTVYNELLGLSRRLQRKDAGMKAVDEVVRLIGDKKADYIPTMLTNAATTSYAFGESERSLELFGRAEDMFQQFELQDSYEFTSFLNNRAGVLCQLERYDEAEADYRLAIERLQESGGHEGEIAVTLISLAHLTFDRWKSAESLTERSQSTDRQQIAKSQMERNQLSDKQTKENRTKECQLLDKQTMYETVEALLDEAWEQINCEGLVHDEKYAFILTKIAPSYEYFKRPIYAKALRETAEEIYHN